MSFKKTRIVDDAEKTNHEYHLELDGKDCKFVIQEPDFKQIATAMGNITTLSGHMDLASAGKFIFDTCCVGWDEEIGEHNPKVFVSICIDIATNHVVPTETNIKKK